MECYKEFAHIYDNLIKGDVDYFKWANIILDLCDEFNVTKKEYLDLACGTGNLTEHIAKGFLNTWAVDLSDDMLTEAENKLRNKGIKGKFICQDISELELNKQFNLITCCLDSTNYLTENEDILNYFKGVHKHLKDEGIFIFDINSYYKLSNILGNNIFTYDEENVYYTWENVFEDNIVDMYLTFFLKEGELYRRFDEHHTERAYTEKELEELIVKAGFKIAKVLDNYEHEDISSTSERIVYVLTK